jgi:hypothetical protein
MSLEVHSEVTGCHHPSYVVVWWGVSHQGWHIFVCASKVWKLVPDCVKRMCYMELWNLLTQLPSLVRNGSFSRTELLLTRPRRLRSGCGGTFRPLSAPRIGPRGVRTSTPWTINCGLFWWMWLAESVTTTWIAWRDPSRKQRQRGVSHFQLMPSLLVCPSFPWSTYFFSGRSMAKYRLIHTFDGIRQERNWETFGVKTCCQHMPTYQPLYRYKHCIVCTWM